MIIQSIFITNVACYVSSCRSIETILIVIVTIFKIYREFNRFFLKKNSNDVHTIILNCIYVLGLLTKITFSLVLYIRRVQVQWNFVEKVCREEGVHLSKTIACRLKNFTFLRKLVTSRLGRMALWRFKCRELCSRMLSWRSRSVGLISFVEKNTTSVGTTPLWVSAHLNKKKKILAFVEFFYIPNQ